jgi:AcrR family transcriptional regulator
MARGLSQRAHTKVLEAATELFAGQGIDGTSVDSIAAKSGVSKATIYKHWADKDALCMGVLMHVHELDPERPEPNTGDLRADLKAYLQYEPSPKKAAVQKRLMPHLIAYSARNEAFGRAWKLRVMERARNKLKELLRRGIEQGIFPTILDEELGVALLLGPMLFRHVFGSSINQEWLAEGAVASYWKANARPEFQKRETKPAPEKKELARKPKAK